jgi:glutathione peroxidase
VQLSQLAEAYHGKGLEILAFPCNQFGGQEPGGSREIADFANQFPAGASGNGVTVMEKIDVNGRHTHPVYRWLKRRTLRRKIRWNFASKFIIDRAGEATRHDGVDPQELAPQIEAALSHGRVGGGADMDML